MVDTNSTNSNWLNNLLNAGLGAYTSTTNSANAAKNTAQQNKLAAANSANTQRLVIFGVIGVVIVGIIFLVLRRK